MKTTYQPTALPPDYKDAFQKADIRGEFPNEINDGLAFRVAYAFVSEFKMSKVVVGRDMRLSSPLIHEAFVLGVRAAGADVIDIGLVTTPMLYFVCGTENLYGVMITASHSPKNFNGLKLVKPGDIPLTNTNGLSAIKKGLKDVPVDNFKVVGKLQKKNIYKAYYKFIKDKVDYKNSVPVSLAMDAGNGMATLLSPLFDSYKKINTKKIFFEMDGTFPNHASNPTIAKNQKSIIAELKNHKHDFGVAFDGDADRVAFFDEKGMYVNAAHVGALLADYYLEEDKKRKFVCTVLTSQIYKETILGKGGKALYARVGHSFIKQEMRKQKAYFACEHSAHFYFQDYFYADSVTMAIFHVLKIYEQAKLKGQTFSEMIRPYTKYHQTEDYMVEVEDKESVLKVLTLWLKNQKPKELIEYDGVTAVFADYQVVVKPSVTEDAINIMAESVSKKMALAGRKLVTDFIKEMTKD